MRKNIKKKTTLLFTPVSAKRLGSDGAISSLTAASSWAGSPTWMCLSALYLKVN
jgi:hypothetical protein